MTANNTERAETARQDGDRRAQWSTPVVKRMQAGDAEDGFDPVTPDAALTFS